MAWALDGQQGRFGHGDGGEHVPHSASLPVSDVYGLGHAHAGDPDSGHAHDQAPRGDPPSWYNEAVVDKSLEDNPLAWPPGSWEHHRLDCGDTDEEPNVVKETMNKSSDTKPHHRKIPSTYPSAFTASPGESYKEWRRAVECWIAGEGGQLPSEVIGPRVLTVLKGRASVIVRHLKVEDVSKADGLRLVLRALEDSPMVRELDGQRGEKAQREFLRCKRQAGESMDSFIMRVQAQRAVMEEEDESFSVGDRFLVGYILDNAEITLKDRVMLLAAAQNQMTTAAIFPALRRMGPFLQGTVPVGKGVLDNPLLPELRPDQEGGQGKSGASSWTDRDKKWSTYRAHVADIGDVPSGYEEDTASLGPSSYEMVEEELVPEELEAATHAALAAFNASQSRLRAIKQARGYFKKTEPSVNPERKERLKKLMAENPCRACGQLGHWSKDPECPRNQNRSASSALASSILSSPSTVTTSGSLPVSSSPEPAADHAAMSAVLEQMMRQSAQSYMAGVAACDVRGLSFDINQGISSLATQHVDVLSNRMVVDLGCLRTVAGVEWLCKEVERCKTQGRTVFVERAHDYFRFGDGVRRLSKYRVWLEVGIAGHVGLLGINSVEYPCPPLLSKWVCSALGLQLDCGTGRFDLCKIGVQSQQLLQSPEGHFLLDIASFHDTWPSWQQLQSHGHQPKISVDELRMYELREGRPCGRGVRRIAAQKRKSSASLHTRLAVNHGNAPPAPGACQPQPISSAGELRSRTANAGGDGGLGRRGGSLSSAQVEGWHEVGRINEQRVPEGEDTIQDPAWQPREEPTSSGEARDAAQEQGGVNDHTNQERTDVGDHRGVGQLPNPGHDSELRCGVQHIVGAPRPAGDPQVEADDLDAPSKSCLPIQPSPVEAQPTLAVDDVCPRDRSHLGASGLLQPSADRPQGAAADALMSPEVREVRRQLWNRGQVQRLKKATVSLKQGIDNLTMVASSLNQPCWKVLEIFGGSASVSLVAQSTRQWIAIEPVDLIYGSDLLDRKEQLRVLRQIDEWEPDLCCLEPPCGPWSPLQALNDQELVAFKRDVHFPFWAFSKEVWVKQHRAGRLVLLEQPLRSAALQLECMKSRPHVHKAVVDQCQFGLCDPLTEKLYRKRTSLDVNSEIFAAALMQHAACTHTPDQHEAIEGRTMVEGKWVNRSLIAGTWTKEFAMHILKSAAIALTHGACLRQQVAGFSTYVLLSDEQPFLRVSPADVVCNQDSCYERGLVGCSLCHVALCSGCQAAHVCDSVDEPVIETIDEHLVLVAGEGEEGIAPEGSYVPEAIQSEEELRRLFKKLQQEEDERTGDYSGVGSRYAYIKFVGPSLRTSKTLRNQVAKLHGVFGHPSNDRLARMLHMKGAIPEVVEAAKNLRCEICARVSAPQSAPKSSATNPEYFNAHCSMDSFYVLDADGVRWNVTHIVDGFCTLQYAVFSKNPSSGVSCDLLFDKWILIHGPMKKLTVDGGPEFRAKFPPLCALYNIDLSVLPTSAKWKAGLAERHGAILKLMFLRIIHELTLKKEWELKYGLAMVVQAKNRLMRRCGMSPIQVVQGRDEVLPSSLLAQVDKAEVKFSSNAVLLEQAEQQKMEQLRQAAASAFHWLDSHERLRMALNSRSRPPHLRADALVPGTVVYFFKQPGQAKRMQDYATGYQGPAVVACADGPTRLWLRYKGSVVRVAIENVRLATAEEEVDSRFILDAMKEIEDDLTAGRRPAGYDDLDEPTAGAPTADAPQSSEPARDSELRDQNTKEEEGGETKPLTTEEAMAQQYPSSWMPVARQSEDACRRLDGLPPKSRPGPYEPSSASVPKKVEFFDTGGRPEQWPSILKDVSVDVGLGSALHRLNAETAVREIEDEIGKTSLLGARERDGLLEEPVPKCQKLGDAEPSEPGVSSLAPVAAEGRMALEAWALSTTSSEAEVKRVKEMFQEFDAHQLELERGHRAGPEPGPRGEIYLKDMTPSETKLTEPALIKALDIHFQYDAVEPVPADQLVSQEETLQSRFVIVNKKWLQREFAPKGRLCVGGHRDPQAGEYETSSPTAILLGHHLLLVVAVCKGWLCYVGDITAAFLQGLPLPRDKPLYIWMPRKLPTAVQAWLNQKLSGFRVDLVKVKKGVFGLNESPRLWYLGFRDQLMRLGFREMSLAPCVFTLHQDNILIAMATVHVDDVLVAGAPEAEPVWTELQKRLTFGSWNAMTDGVKFLGRHLKQSPNTFEITASMHEYCAEIPLIPVNAASDDDRALSDTELALLRTVIGKLSWAARQGRPDVLFMVSMLQQSIKDAKVKHLRIANAVSRIVHKEKNMSFVNVGCDIEQLLVVVASDGAYGTMPGGKSQQGWVVALASPDIKEKAARMNMVEWQSTSCKRIVRSSMAIEASAASMAFEHAEYVRALLAEVVQENFQVRTWGQFIRKWQLVLVLDAKTAFDTLRTETLPQDRRTALDLLAIKEALLDEGNFAAVKWVPGPQQLPDSLTKEKGNGILSQFMDSNEWALVEDAIWQAERAKQRECQKGYKQRVKQQRAAIQGTPG